MLIILLEYLWWWEMEKATNCLYLVTGLELAELLLRKQKSALMLGIEQWMESTEYAYVHLSAHMETPEFRWLNLLLHPFSVIWQNIYTQQNSLLACLLDRIWTEFWNSVYSRLSVCLPGRLSASQHAAIPSLSECSKKSCLLFMFLLVWAFTAILWETTSFLFYIKIIYLSIV